MPSEFTNPAYVSSGSVSGSGGDVRVITVANAAARIALLQANAAGRLVEQADDSSIWCLVPGGFAAQSGDWKKVGWSARGTMAGQNANSVAITGGAVSGVTIGAITFADAAAARLAIGLSHVNDTADGDKPVSAAQATADAAVLNAAAADATAKANAALAAAAEDSTSKVQGVLNDSVMVRTAAQGAPQNSAYQLDTNFGNINKNLRITQYLEGPPIKVEFYYTPYVGAPGPYVAEWDGFARKVKIYLSNPGTGGATTTTAAYIVDHPPMIPASPEEPYFPFTISLVPGGDGSGVVAALAETTLPMVGGTAPAFVGQLCRVGDAFPYVWYVAQSNPPRKWKLLESYAPTLIRSASQGPPQDFAEGLREEIVFDFTTAGCVTGGTFEIALSGGLYSNTYVINCETSYTGADFVSGVIEAFAGDSALMTYYDWLGSGARVGLRAKTAFSTGSPLYGICYDTPGLTSTINLPATSEVVTEGSDDNPGTAASGIGQLCRVGDDPSFSWYVAESVARAQWKRISTPNEMRPVPVVIEDASITLELVEDVQYLRLTNEGANTVNVPEASLVPWPIGYTIYFRRAGGAGAVSLVGGSGVIINNGAASAAVPANGNFAITYLGSDEWDFI